MAWHAKCTWFTSTFNLADLFRTIIFCLLFNYLIIKSVSPHNFSLPNKSREKCNFFFKYSVIKSLLCHSCALPNKSWAWKGSIYLQFFNHLSAKGSTILQFWQLSHRLNTIIAVSQNGRCYGRSVKSQFMQMSPHPFARSRASNKRSKFAQILQILIMWRTGKQGNRARLSHIGTANSVPARAHWLLLLLSAALKDYGQNRWHIKGTTQRP